MRIWSVVVLSLLITPVLTAVPLAAPDSTTGDDSTTIRTENHLTTRDLSLVPYRDIDKFTSIFNGVVAIEPSGLDSMFSSGRREMQNGSWLYVRGGQYYDHATTVAGISFDDPISGVANVIVPPTWLSSHSLQHGMSRTIEPQNLTGRVTSSPRSNTEDYSVLLEGISDNVVGTGHDQNWYSAYVNGPLADRGYFAGGVQRHWLADRAPSIKTEDFLPGNPDRLPFNSSRGWTYHGRLGYTISPEFSASITGHGSTDEWREYRQEWLMHPEHTPKYKDDNTGFRASLDYKNSQNMRASLGAYYTQIERRMGDGVLFDDLAAYEGQQTWFEQFNLFRADSTVFPQYYHRKARTIGVDAYVTRVLPRGHQITFAAGYTRHTVRLLHMLDATNPRSGVINRYGFGLDDSETEADDWRHDAKHPSTLGATLSGQFTFEAVTITPMLHISHTDYDAMTLVDPQSPFGSDNSTLDRQDLEDAKAYTRVSPSLRVTYHSEDNLEAWIGWGIRYRTPPYTFVHKDWEFFETRYRSGSAYPFPSGQLEPEKVTEAELGTDWRPLVPVTIGVRSFYYDFDKLPALQHISAQPVAYDVYQSVATATSRGVEVAVSGQRGAMGVQLRYTLSKTETNDPAAFAAYIINWQNPRNLPDQYTAAYDRPHVFTGMLTFAVDEFSTPFLKDFHVRQVNVQVLGHAASGLPYTPFEIYDAVSHGSGISQTPAGQINSQRTPAVYQFDLSVEVGMKAGNMVVTPFLWIRNIFNRENISGVYAGTGLPDNTGYLSTPEGQVRVNDPTTGEEFERTYLLRQADPLNYSIPRQVFLGVRVEL